jgi:hypothetical protein
MKEKPDLRIWECLVRNVRRGLRKELHDRALFWQTYLLSNEMAYDGLLILLLSAVSCSLCHKRSAPHGDCKHTHTPITTSRNDRKKHGRAIHGTHREKNVSRKK